MKVSNFVFGAWSDPQSTSGPYDQMGVPTTPFSKTDGGYVQYVDPTGQRQQYGMRAEWRSPSVRGAKREALHAARHEARVGIANATARALGAELAALGVKPKLTLAAPEHLEVTNEHGHEIAEHLAKYGSVTLTATPEGLVVGMTPTLETTEGEPAPTVAPTLPAAKPGPCPTCGHEGICACDKTSQ
jgi:hypothetical protein